MLILKPFILVSYGNALQTFEGLYLADLKLGQIGKNLFKVKSEKPFQFVWKINLGIHEPVLYGDSIEDCKEQAIEIFREFMFKILQ